MRNCHDCPTKVFCQNLGFCNKEHHCESSALPAGSTADPLTVIPMLAKRQDALQDQLDDLYGVALRLGMHDACEWLRNKGIHD